MRGAVGLLVGGTLLGAVACERARDGAEEVVTRLACSMRRPAGFDAPPSACACAHWHDGDRAGTICVQIEPATSTADARSP